MDTSQETNDSSEVLGQEEPTPVAYVNLQDYNSSSPESVYNEDKYPVADLENDAITAKLAAAGPVGVAAAAAIKSSKRRRFCYSFETNPAVRKRIQNRLLRKLQKTIDEFASRVGQQAIVLMATPGKLSNSYRVFGTKPLDSIIKNLQDMIMGELETALENQAPPPIEDNPSLHELPPLVIDGIPTPVEKMTQAQLRAFIPLMLKYATGRGKPGWGRESTKPLWWPEDVPWANIRMDMRSENEKSTVSWTHALRKIVINCYKHFGREDLLPEYKDNEEQQEIQQQATGETENSELNAPYVVHTLVTNSDGSVSVIQLDTNNPVITLADGTMAHIQDITALQTIQSDGVQLQAVQKVDGSGGEVSINGLVEYNADGQIVITGEDGQISNLITIPVTSEIYQSMLGNMQVQSADGRVIQFTKVEPGFGQNLEIQQVVGQEGQTILPTSEIDETQLIRLPIKEEAGVTLDNSNSS